MQAILPNSTLSSSSITARRLFCLTDGGVESTSAVLEFVKENCGNTRIFTFGVGHDVSVDLIEGLATNGGGVAEFISDSGFCGKLFVILTSFTESIYEKVLYQLKRGLQLDMSDVKIDWGGMELVEKPQLPTTVFVGDCLRLLAFFHSSGTTLHKLTFHGTIGLNKISFCMMVDSSKFITNTIIHRLAAKSRVNYLEETSTTEETRNEIISVATKYQLLSNYTSFVIVQPLSTTENSGSQQFLSTELRIIQAEKKRPEHHSVWCLAIRYCHAKINGMDTWGRVGKEFTRDCKTN